MFRNQFKISQPRWPVCNTENGPFKTVFTSKQTPKSSGICRLQAKSASQSSTNRGIGVKITFTFIALATAEPYSKLEQSRRCFNLHLAPSKTKRPTYQLKTSKLQSSQKSHSVKTSLQILSCLEMGQSYKTLEMLRDLLSPGSREVALQVIAYCDIQHSVSKIYITRSKLLSTLILWMTKCNNQLHGD